MTGTADALDRTVARILRWGIGASIALLAFGKRLAGGVADGSH